MELAELTKQIDALNERAQSALADVEAGTASVEEVKALINDEIKPALDSLTQERADRQRELEAKAVREQLSTLTDAIEGLRKPDGEFVFGSSVEVTSDREGKALDGYASGAFSYFSDVRAANKGIGEARERLTADLEGKALNGVTLNAEGKAMTEGTNSQGGYLVQPSVERAIVEAKELDNVLRGLCSKINVTTNAVQFDSIGLSTSAGWVAELAQKPESTGMTLASVTANVFTAAGLATISNQLLADSSPAVDELVTDDLAKRLVALEETAFLTGSGSGQPLGILNTPGISTTSITDTGVSTTGGLLDKILDAILTNQTNFGQPSAILMHPRTWTRIIKDKNAQGYYTLNDSTSADITRPRPAGGTLFGVQVVLSNRVPINLGGGTNESRVIVGDFREALILDRQGITVDESPHVYFTTNQTVFRAEFRVGFTAARTPLAFNVIGGAGLANG